MVMCVPLAPLLNGITNSFQSYSRPGDFVGSVTVLNMTTISLSFEVLIGEWGYIVASLHRHRNRHRRPLLVLWNHNSALQSETQAKIKL
jgi:hypothetical protein